MSTTLIVPNWQKTSQTGEVPSGMSVLRENIEFKVVQAREIKEDKTGRKRMRLTGIVQKADVYNENGRIYGSKILSEAVGAIQPAIKNRKVMGEFDHPCRLDSDFRVLTVDGWKEFKDIKVGDYVWSRVNGQMVKSRVNQIINEPYVGAAYKISGRNIDDAFTPGHRKLLLERPDRGKYNETYATVEDIYCNRNRYNHSPIPRVAEWLGDMKDTFVLPGIPQDELKQSWNNSKKLCNDLVLNTMDFAGFLGLYLAEGNIHNTRGVCISQTTEHNRGTIRDLLFNLHSELQWSETKRGFYVNDERLARYLRPLGDKYTKFIPNDVKRLGSEYLNQLIYWFAIGDGRMMVAGDRDSQYTSCKSKLRLAHNSSQSVIDRVDLGKYSRMSIFTVSKQLIDDLHECVVKIGKCAMLSKIETTEDYIFADHLIEAKNKVPLWQLHISRQQNIYLDPRFTSMEKIHHDGNIYCLSVDHKNFYMEHNGHSYWTGNSDAKIHMDRVSHLMTKVWMEGKNVLGELEVLEEMPCGQMLAALVRAGVTVGISSRGIGDMKPIMAESLQEAYEVLPGYRFVTWDTVAEPSVKEAELSVMESKQRMLSQKKQLERELVAEITKKFGQSVNN